MSDGSNTYLYGLNRIAQQNIVGRQYYLGDALGSARQLVNPVGAVIQARSYEPFGKQLSTAGNPLTKYGYTGEWSDPTNLIYLRARYYDPATGRFLTRDLFPGLLHAPHTQHPYGYAANNPATYTDPSGLFAPWDVLDIGSFLWSLHDFVECPSWGNAGWLALDVIGLLPVIPSIGLIGKIGKIDDFAKAANKIDELIQLAHLKYPQLAGKYHLHHIIPMYLGGDPGETVIKLDAAYHQLITNEFRALWPYRSSRTPWRYPTPNELQGILRQVYSKYPLP